MIRKAFLMKLNPGCEEEYEKRHNPIWPELDAMLRAHGVLNYSIYLDKETNTLFGYAEIESEEKWNASANTDVCRRWWGYMSSIMPSNPDKSPVSRELREVFHIEKTGI